MITLYLYLLYAWYNFNGLLLSLIDAAEFMTWVSWSAGIFFSIITAIVFIAGFVVKEKREYLSKAFGIGLWVTPTYFIDSYAFASMNTNIELLVLLNLIIICSATFRQLIKHTK